MSSPCASDDPAGRPAPEAAPPIFVGGAGRSGTTLLRVMLDSHPRIACGPELKIIPSIARLWEDMAGPLAPTLARYDTGPAEVAAMARGCILDPLERYRKKRGRARVAEKTPDNVLWFVHLARLFPASPLVHVIRDGRDVVSSLRKMNWVHPGTNQPDPRTRDTAEAARYWTAAVRTGRVAATISDRYLEIRYEDLVSRTEPTLRLLCEHVGEAFDPRMLDYWREDRDLAGESSAARVREPVDGRALGRWRSELTGEDRRIVESIAGPLLRELGYAA